MYTYLHREKTQASECKVYGLTTVEECNTEEMHGAGAQIKRSILLLLQMEFVMFEVRFNNLKIKHERTQL